VNLVDHVNKTKGDQISEESKDSKESKKSKESELSKTMIPITSTY
jgi:hypothetical protein